jgi:hypothetical protein
MGEIGASFSPLGTAKKSWQQKIGSEIKRDRERSDNHLNQINQSNQ